MVSNYCAGKWLAIFSKYVVLVLLDNIYETSDVAPNPKAPFFIRSMRPCFIKLYLTFILTSAGSGIISVNQNIVDSKSSNVGSETRL